MTTQAPGGVPGQEERPNSVAGWQQATPRDRIAPPSIPDLVYRELRGWIVSGRLKPGPVKIADLARHFGVSTVPIREALRRLEAEGFVTFDHNRSVKVNALSLEDLREIFLMREHLEGCLIERAAETFPNEATYEGRLLDLLNAMDEPGGGEFGEWRDANADFHWLLYETVPLRRVKTVVQSLWSASEPFVRLYVTANATEAVHEAQAEHWQLLELLRSHRGPEAAELLRSHLRSTLRIVEERLTSLAAIDGTEMRAAMTKGAP